MIYKALTAYRVLLLIICFAFFLSNANTQNPPADSLWKIYKKEKTDTGKVNILCDLAGQYYSFNPDSSRILAEEALFLARRIRFVDGESRSLGKLANAFIQIANYPRALEFYIDRLKIEENRDIPQNLANVHLNIGTVYAYQEEYDKALSYYYRADSIMQTMNDNNATDVLKMKTSIAINIGDLYFRINKLDSSNMYYHRSLDLARQWKNGDYIGTSLLGLGEVYLTQKNYTDSKEQLQAALTHLQASNNDNLICETYYDLAVLHDSLHVEDSAKYYAAAMLTLAKKDGFLRWQLSAAEYFNQFYKKQNRLDSAYSYLVFSLIIKDSINNNEKVRQVQVMSSNEQLRQSQLAEDKRIARYERKQELQWLLIGLCIPVFFLVTLMISKIRTRVWVVRTSGIISLLILFEYLTLLLHPYVANLTGHTPVYELLIFVCVAAVLIRAHHRIEELFIHLLIKRRGGVSEGIIRTKKVRIKMKKPPENDPGGTNEEIISD